MNVILFLLLSLYEPKVLHGDIVVSMQMNDKLLITGNYKGQVDIWDLTKYEKIKTIDVNKNCTIHSLIFDDRFLIFGTEGAIYIHDIKTLDLIHKFETNFAIYSLAINGNLLASGNECGCIQLWNLKNFTQSRMLILGLSGVNFLKFSPNGKMLAGINNNSVGKIWEISSQKERVLLEKCDWVGDFSKDGKFFAYGTIYGEIRLLNLISGEIKISESFNASMLGKRFYAISFFPEVKGFYCDGTFLCLDNTRGNWFLSEQQFPLNYICVYENCLACSKYTGDIFIFKLK